MNRLNSLLFRYGLAVLAPLAMLELRLYLADQMSISNVLVTPFFLAPALIAAAIGGLLPGLLATVLSTFVYYRFLLAPWPQALDVTDTQRLIVILVFGTIMSVMLELMHRARRRAETLAADAVQRAGELRAINDRLSLSERTLSQAQRVARFGTWEADVASNTSRFSPELCDLIGVPPDTRLDYAAASALTYPEDLARVEASFRACIAQHAPEWRVEHRRLHPLRGLIWLEVRAEISYDERGKVKRMLGATMDVTERRRAEDALRASERMLSLIYENSRDALYLAQADDADRYVCVSVNQTFLKIAGLRREQVIGRLMEEVLPAGNHVKVRAQYRRAIEARRPVAYEEIADLPAGPRYGEIYLIPIFKDDGPVTHILGAIKDITEHRRAQKKLRESEEQFRRAMEEAPIPVIMYAEDGEVLQVSKTWTQLTGFALADVPTFDSWLTKAYGQGADEVREQVKRLFAGKLAMVAVEFEVYTRTGDKRVWAYSASCPGRLQDGRRFAVGMAVDITDRKEAEQALKEADKRKDEFLATLAHELRNPLAPIRNALAILRMDTPPSPAAEHVLEMMERQLSYLVRLVDDLFEVSRITRGNIELRLERTDLGTLIRSAVETSRPLIDAAGHALMVELPQEPIQVDADPVRLVQVFANLINNAAKYTPDGGQIRVSARADDTHVIVSVLDNGNGITPEMQPRVFDMFTQLESPALYKRGGLGLGLTIVRGLVRMHSGTVDVRSEGPGKGSEFLVCLPLATSLAPAQPATPTPVPAPDAAARRIMVVDDNQDAADSLGMLLRMSGAHTHVVYGGQQALEALDSANPDVIFMDLGMPGVDGYETAKRIRQHPRLGKVMLIALSGWGQENDRKRSRAAGFDHHLIKPADFNVLQALLASLPQRPDDSGKVVQLFG